MHADTPGMHYLGQSSSSSSSSRATLLAYQRCQNGLTNCFFATAVLWLHAPPPPPCTRPSRTMQVDLLLLKDTNQSLHVRISDLQAELAKLQHAKSAAEAAVSLLKSQLALAQQSSKAADDGMARLRAKLNQRSFEVLLQKQLLQEAQQQIAAKNTQLAAARWVKGEGLLHLGGRSWGRERGGGMSSR